MNSISKSVHTAIGGLRLAVGIATRGRPQILAETLRQLAGQTRAPDRIVVAHVTDADVGDVNDYPEVEYLKAPEGLPRQRNAILDALADCDIVLFLDDDFLPANDYIHVTLTVFNNDRHVVVTTGRVLADGARGPGVSPEAGRAILQHAGDRSDGPTIRPAFNGYGCNMALRLDAIRRHGLRFDERLPLYAWFEDVDLCRRVAPYGSILEIATATGVHLGVKSGRTSGRRLGYSQVVNPLYLWRKGSLPLRRALHGITRHLLINSLRSLRPEPWVDRRGRLMGNVLAAKDLLRGRAAPERILDL